MKQVIIFPRGQLNARDKERMSKVGIVAVEADDPSKVVSLLPEPHLFRADDFIMSLFKGVAAGKGWSDNRCAQAFFEEIHTRVKKRNGEADDAATPPKARP